MGQKFAFGVNLLRFLKIVVFGSIYFRMKQGGYRWVTDGLPKGCCLGCKWLDYWKLNEVKNNAHWRGLL